MNEKRASICGKIKVFNFLTITRPAPPLLCKIAKWKMILWSPGILSDHASKTLALNFYKQILFLDVKINARNKHNRRYVSKIWYNNLQDYAASKIIFSGLIQVANPMHLDAVTSGCDRGGSTTFWLSGVCRILIWNLIFRVWSIDNKAWHHV